MKTFFSKSHETQARNKDIAKNNLYVDGDYYCEGQEVQVNVPEKDETIQSKENINVKQKKQKFFASYNMFF